MGPSAIRYAGLSEKLGELGHKVDDKENIDTPIAEAIKIEHSKAKYLTEVRKVCLRLSKAVSASLKVRQDCRSFSAAITPSQSAPWLECTRAQRKRRKTNLDVIWLDAHGDFNTPDITPSGNIHGMSLALSAGQGGKWLPSPPWPKRAVDPTRIVIVGARQLDPAERTNLEEDGSACVQHGRH